MKFGVQTFTVRREQKRSIRSAYLPLIDLGIKSFEVARIHFDEKSAKEIAALRDEYGIEVSSIQVKPKQVFGERAHIVSFCRSTGCKNVVISMLPFGCILGSESAFYSFVDTLDGEYEKYEAEGITLAYHHHNWEYIKLSCGKTRMQELLSRTEKIKFVHDTYWTARCGISPDRQIAEFGDRLLGVHLRDLTFGKFGLSVVAKDAAVGDGVIDFARTLAAARDVGCSYYVIEQNSKNPYGDIEKSFKCLEALRMSLEGKE